jgi:CHAD domain-containing protein
VKRFKRVQQLLGDLNDLRVLRAAIDDALNGKLKKALPELNRLLEERSGALWQEWRSFAEELLQPAQRHGLLRDLLLESGVAAAVEGPVEAA